MIHLALHFVVPLVVAVLWKRPPAGEDSAVSRWRPAFWAYAVMVATMVVDIDHLLADPIYDPGRCSIGFHPLHHPMVILLYAALCFVPNTWARLTGVGLLIHMALDSLDCQVTNGVWFVS